MQDNTETMIQEMAWKTLIKAGRDIPVPFKLSIPNSNNDINCEHIVRIIPKKRIVAFGIWNGKPIVAKIFFERVRAKEHFERELTAIEELILSGTPTPRLLWKGSLQKNRIHVLIFERILDATNLGTLWQQRKNTEELSSLMQAVTIELATQHVLGVVQTDLHLNNFLISKNQIYTLDAGSINFIHEILPKEQSLDHLGLFFSQLGVGTEKLQEKLFQAYVEARSWIVSKADTEALRRATQRWSQKRWERYEKKIQRNSTAFSCTNTFSALTIYDRSYQSPEFINFLKHPEAYIQRQDAQVLKAGNSSTVVKIKIDDRCFVVKRYNMKSFSHWLRRCLRQSRAMNSWLLAHHLTLFGVLTAKPVAFIENHILGLRGKSYFIMEAIEGVTAGAFFNQYKAEDPIYASMATRIIAQFFNLAHLRLMHGDLKMTNILIENQRPYLIDLDGMVEYRTQAGLQNAFRKEMQRFMKNWETRPEIYALFDKLIGPLLK